MNDDEPRWWEFVVMFATVWTLVAWEGVYRLVSGLRRRLGR